MPDAHANFAYSLVATAPSPADSGTSLVVTAGQGSRFPDPATVGAYNCTIWATAALPTPANAEIVRVTAKSTDTLTITRTQESSSARTVVVGDQIAMTITKKTLTDVEGGWMFVSSVELTDDATAVFVLQNSIYKNYMFVIEHLVPVTDAVLLLMRTSTDGGSSYDAGASDYSWTNQRYTDAGTTAVAADGADSELTLAADVGWGSDANEDMNGCVWLFAPETAAYTSVMWQMVGQFVTNNTLCLDGGGQRRAAANVDAVQFLFSSGNLETGTIRMYGQRGS